VKWSIRVCLVFWLPVLASCQAGVPRVHDDMNWDWLGPSVLAVSVLEDLYGEKFRTPSGTEWTVSRYIDRPSNMSFSCGTLMRTLPSNDSWNMMLPGLWLDNGGTMRVLYASADGDVADLYYRITGKKHSALKGEMSEEYEAFLREPYRPPQHALRLKQAAIDVHSRCQLEFDAMKLDVAQVKQLSRSDAVVVFKNGKSYSVGSWINDELFIQSADRDHVRFVYKGFDFRESVPAR
jgi:hypothetical protein